MKLYVLIIISLCVFLPTFGQDDTEKNLESKVDSIVTNDAGSFIRIDVNELEALRNENNSLIKLGEEFMWKCFTTSQVTEIQRQTDTPQN